MSDTTKATNFFRALYIALGIFVLVVIAAEVNYNNALRAASTESTDAEIATAMSEFGLNEDPSFTDKVIALL